MVNFEFYFLGIVKVETNVREKIMCYEIKDYECLRNRHF